jgi:hypothetical protein
MPTRKSWSFSPIFSVSNRFASIGDRKQLGAVDAGKPFDVMQRSGVETATMDANIRARTKALRTAQQAAQGGRIDEALRHLGKNVVEVGEGAAIEAAAAWLSLAPVERERTAIYASGRALRRRGQCRCSDRAKGQWRTGSDGTEAGRALTRQHNARGAALCIQLSPGDGRRIRPRQSGAKS